MNVYFTREPPVSCELIFIFRESNEGRKIKRILLAESSDVMPMALESFGVSDTDVPMIGISDIGDVCLLVPCTSLEAAESLLRHDIDLIVCGLQFDESRMFDLLRSVKANPATRSIPFLCVKAVAGVLDRTIHESIKIAVRALGAVGFYDLAEQRRTLGEELALKQIGDFMYRLVSTRDCAAAREMSRQGSAEQIGFQ